MAEALGVDCVTMAAWEAGTHAADRAGVYAYLRLLNVFSAQLPTACEPNWGALRKPALSADSAPASSSVGMPSAPAPRPARRGSRWTWDEKDYLRSEYLRGTAVEELAQSLGRSAKSVRWELYHLKLAPFPAQEVKAPLKRQRPQGPKAYTVEDKRKAHPWAYESWSPQDGQLLAQRSAHGISLADLAVSSAVTRAASSHASSRSRPTGRRPTKPGTAEEASRAPTYPPLPSCELIYLIAHDG